VVFFCISELAKDFDTLEEVIIEFNHFDDINDPILTGWQWSASKFRHLEKLVILEGPRMKLGPGSIENELGIIRFGPIFRALETSRATWRRVSCV
jgi:hypothetical protein